MAAELIALDSSKQSAFTKAVKNIKKSIAAKQEQKDEDKKYARGIILVQHLPYGFFEEGLEGFFSQFGKVLRVRLARSKKTGRSKGYAFVEFEFEEVAKIAAEAMNNYLMFERLIKCKLLPSGTNGRKIFAGNFIREDNYPKLKRQEDLKKQLAEPMDEEEESKCCDSRLNKIVKHNEKLAKLGINYQFKMSTHRISKLTPLQTKSPADDGDSKFTETVKAKFSPKILRNKTRKSEGFNTTNLTQPQIKSPAKQSEDGDSKFTEKVKAKLSPKILRSKTRKSEGFNTTKLTQPLIKSPANQSEVGDSKFTQKVKAKLSPKILRSKTRKSEGFNTTELTQLQTKSPAKQAEGDSKFTEKVKSKFSPKMLRSRARKSEGFSKSSPSANAAKKNQRKSIK